MQQLSQDSQAMEQAINIIKSMPFATLISLNNDAQVCHLPLYFHQQTRTFYGHSAGNNPMINQLINNQDANLNNVKLVFTGEHAYVSPTWHQDIRVPTWDYAVVHVNGRLEQVSQQQQRQQLMIEQISQFESHWQLNDVPTPARQQMLKAITVFKISANSFYGKFKLSQNKSQDAKQAIAEQLQNQPKMVKQYHQHW